MQCSMRKAEGEERRDTVGALHTGPAPRTSARRLVAALVVLTSFGLGVTADRTVLPSGSGASASSSFTDLPAFSTLQETWDLIHSEYVDPTAIDDEAMIYGAAQGMVETLGDTGHSTFLSPEQAEAFQDATRGEFIGIGVELDFREGVPIVVAPIDGSPADKANIKPRDMIVAIDGIETEGRTQVDVFSSLRGEEGTVVVVSFKRPGEDRRFSVKFERTRITIIPVTWTMLPGGVALIRLSEFSQGASDDLKRALGEAKSAGATSLILDLRNNPGGLVQEAVDIASLFLPGGTPIYQFREREGEPSVVRATGLRGDAGLPMVVLINGGSASSAEIVASSLQEGDRAQLIGETTYGTGTVLTPMTLDDGSMLLLGTGLWLSADGDQLWHTGVEPGKLVELDSNATPLRPADLANITAAQIGAVEDEQLKEAYRLLTE